MQLVEVLVAGRPAALVELVEVAVEAEQRPENLGVEILDDRIGLVDPVLERRAGEDEGVGRDERLHLPRGLGLPVLDALGLVENDHVGLEKAVDVVGVAHHLLVVDEREEGGRRILIELQPLGMEAGDEARRRGR